MVLEQHRARGDRYLKPMAQVADRWGLSADALTVVSLGLAIVAGLLLFYGQQGRPMLLALGGLVVLGSALLDAVDGRLARLQGKAGPRGDYLDHVTDRYADLAILLGIGLAPAMDLRLTLFAVTGVLLTSYMGTQAQALGLGRDYRGLLGRADRLVLLGTVPVLQAALPAGSAVLGWAPLALLLLLLGALGNVTAVQRFVSGWRELAGRKLQP
ncbi:MAG TPA: CDP-alcohol phosphatidyltransferase family protein [Candidatus Thermoplasmatota archaeon]|nr:CDP-alcohol phosphatidyltransferase family protein [Candidatus Thermoplasmatota archaeon]